MHVHHFIRLQNGKMATFVLWCGNKCSKFMPNRQKAIHRGIEQSIYSFQAPMIFQSVKLTDLLNREM
jgi:hypothetical protein